MGELAILETRQLVLHVVPRETTTTPLVHAGRDRLRIIQGSDADGDKSETNLRRWCSIVAPENVHTACRTEVPREMLARAEGLG